MNKHTRSLINSLSTEQRIYFDAEYNRRSKSSFAGYAFWVLFGFHYLYLKSVGTQFFFWITLGGFGFWWLIDLFRVPGMVADYNRSVALDIIQQAKVIHAD